MKLHLFKHRYFTNPRSVRRNDMTTPYDKYKNTEEWNLIEKTIQELLHNQDIQITTPIEYVVGYITKQLIEKQNGNTQRKNSNSR